MYGLTSWSQCHQLTVPRDDEYKLWWSCCCCCWCWWCWRCRSITPLVVSNRDLPHKMRDAARL